VVIYGTQTLDSSNNIQTSVEYVNPDGSSKTAYESYDAHVAIAGPNPQKAGFVFAYTADTSNVLYDIYTNTTLTSTGATRLTNQGFSAVSSLQYSPDATKIIFVASIGSDVTASSLYEMNADGSGLHTVDSADDAYLASDGVHIAYTRTDSNGLGQINIVNLDGTGVHAVTSNGDDHFGVQFSKDGSHLTWAEGPFSSSGTGANGPYDIYTAAVDGSQLTKITSVAGGDNADSPTYSPDGTKVGYVLNGADTTKTGVYVVGTNGLGNTVITLDPNTIPGLFWTTSSGILSAHHAAPMIGKSIHILKLKKLGKWPGH
jgi:Tol biopolymer transport system component